MPIRRSGFILMIFLSLSAGSAWARNVTYTGGTALIGSFDDDSFSSLVHYTPYYRYSVGYRYEYFREREWHYNGLQVNYLLHRWNQPDAQANLYILTSVGSGASRDHDTTAAGFVGAAADWENRRLFVSYENRYLNAGETDEFYVQKARLGVAPYVAEFGGIHTWLMIEASESPQREDRSLTFTPLVRFFKGTDMVELGWTIDGGAMANLRLVF